MGGIGFAVGAGVAIAVGEEEEGGGREELIIVANGTVDEVKF